jgi:hypothetical protein
MADSTVVEAIKLATPFATFALGMAAIGFVEYLKDRYKSNKLYKLFKSEIEDELSLLEVRIMNSFRQIKGIELLLERIRGENPPSNVSGIDTLPNKIDFTIIEKHYPEFAHLMSPIQRLALKKMIENNNYMNDWIDELFACGFNEDGFKKRLNLQKRYITTLIVVRYSMIFLLNPEKYKQPNETTKDEIIASTAYDLRVQMTAQDLSYTITGYFDSSSQG